MITNNINDNIEYKVETLNQNNRIKNTLKNKQMETL